MVLAGIGAGLAVIGAGFGIGKIGGSKNSIEHLSEIGKLNTSEQQKIGRAHV